jgi:2-polyprenyl-6-methoxyphenol hydroxylase-like FAD-dependent oxidoreductase
MQRSPRSGAHYRAQLSCGWLKLCRRHQIPSEGVAGTTGCGTESLRRSNWPARSRPTQSKDDDTPYRRDLYLRRLVESAGSQLPTLCALLVEREPNPFVQAIFDYEAPSMVKGRIALFGDAAYIVRPHTAIGVSKAAGDAMTLRNCLTLYQYDSLRRLVGRELLNMGGNSVRRSESDRAGNDNCHVANDQRSRGDHNETARQFGCDPRG